jgi:multiple sugar transport system substrate-binding protein
VRKPSLVWFAIGLAAGLVLAWLPPLLDRGDGLEPGVLVIMMDEDQSVGFQRKRLIGQWEELFLDLPDDQKIEVEIIELPRSATAARSQLVAHAQGGGGDVDIYSLDVTWVAEFVEQRWLRPLDRTAINERAFLETPLEAGRYDGDLWALPFNTDAPLLYYHTGLVSEPDTWQDIADEWQGAVAAGHPLAAAYAGQFADYEGFTVNLLEAVLAHDPAALDGQRWLQGGHAWSAALQRLAEAFAPESGLILPESLEHSEADTLEAFRTMQVPFMRNWPVAYKRLTEVESVEGEPPAGAESVRPEQVGVTTLPGLSEGETGVGVLGGQSLAIARGSDQPHAAQALIEFLTSPRSQEKLFVDGGFVPTQKVVYSDLTEQAEYAYLADVQAAVQQARPRPVHPRYELISEAIRRVVRGYLADAAASAPELADPAELADRLAAELADASDGFRR